MKGNVQPEYSFDYSSKLNVELKFEISVVDSHLLGVDLRLQASTFTILH